RLAPPRGGPAVRGPLPHHGRQRAGPGGHPGRAPERHRPPDPAAGVPQPGRLLGAALARLGAAAPAEGRAAAAAGLLGGALHGRGPRGQQREHPGVARRAGVVSLFRPRLGADILEPGWTHATAVARWWSVDAANGGDARGEWR